MYKINIILSFLGLNCLSASVFESVSALVCYTGIWQFSEHLCLSCVICICMPLFVPLNLSSLFISHCLCLSVILVLLDAASNLPL